MLNVIPKFYFWGKQKSRKCLFRKTVLDEASCILTCNMTLHITWEKTL